MNSSDWREKWVARQRLAEIFKHEYRISVWDIPNGRVSFVVKTQTEKDARDQFSTIALNYCMVNPTRIELTRWDWRPSSFRTLHVMFKPTEGHKKNPCEHCKEPKDPSVYNIDGLALCRRHTTNYLKNVRKR